MKIINDIPNAPAAVGTYSQASFVNNTYYFSGQIGIEPQTGILQEGFDSQLEQILKNIDALLKGCHLNRKNIFKTSIFLVDLSEFSKVNAAYESYFETPYPARSCIEAKALPKGALVEIEVMAAHE